MEITIIAKEACSRILGMKELQYKGMDIHELIGEGIKLDILRQRAST